MNIENINMNINVIANSVNTNVIADDASGTKEFPIFGMNKYFHSILFHSIPKSPVLF